MLKIVLVLVHRYDRERLKHQEEADQYLSNTDTLDRYFVINNKIAKS
jgi:hypothetical protein